MFYSSQINVQVVEVRHYVSQKSNSFQQLYELLERSMCE